MAFLMFFLFITYQIAQIAFLPLIAGYIIFRKIKSKPVFGKFRERIGLVPKPPASGHVIWLHAVSVGEVLSLQSFIEKIKQTNHNTICYLTVGTPAGKEMAQETLAADVISFLPYDFLPSILLAFKRIKPKRLIIVEAEIWPNLLMIAHIKKIPMYLINARVSRRSRNKYRKFKWVLVKLFNLFEMIYTQSAYDKDEIEYLGVHSNKLTIMGEIKSYNVLKKQKNIDHVDQEHRPTLLVGSLHPGELDIYLRLFHKLKPNQPDLKLIIAPRHFHWKHELFSKVQSTEHSFAIWDNEKKPANADSYDILLVCKLGELFNLYQQATIYFLGGTFVPIGGHNLLEPAAWANPIIVGPHYNNCHVTAKQLAKQNGLIVVSNETELLKNIITLLQNPTEAKSIGNNARRWLEDEGRIVARNLDRLVEKLFKP